MPAVLSDGTVVASFVDDTSSRPHFERSRASHHTFRAFEISFLLTIVSHLSPRGLTALSRKDHARNLFRTFASNIATHFLQTTTPRRCPIPWRQVDTPLPNRSVSSAIRAAV